MGTPDEERIVDFSDDDAPLLPEQTSDDTDRGWGDRPSRDANDFRLLDDRPPHWD
ncbi:hypothetical protein [Longispora albida]|uniref:hypothetical protein n=1 Tax=Longispora albida TaxID=203523 RepID=UPI000372646A|nr:hypothetical protein [Longispora albida]